MSQFNECWLSTEDQKRVAEAVARDYIDRGVKLLNETLPFARLCDRTMTRDIGDALATLAGEQKPSEGQGRRR